MNFFRSWFQEKTADLKETPKQKYEHHKPRLTELVHELMDVYGDDWRAFRSEEEVRAWMKRHRKVLLEAAQTATNHEMTGNELRSTWLEDLFRGLQRRADNHRTGEDVAIARELYHTEYEERPRALYSPRTIEILQTSAGLADTQAEAHHYLKFEKQVELLAYHYPETAEVVQQAKTLSWLERIRYLASAEVADRLYAERRRAVHEVEAKEAIGALLEQVVVLELNFVLKFGDIRTKNYQQHLERDRQTLAAMDKEEERLKQQDQALRTKLASYERALQLLWVICESRQVEASSTTDSEFEKECKKLLDQLSTEDRLVLQRVETTQGLQKIADRMEARAAFASQSAGRFSDEMRLPKTSGAIQAYHELAKRIQEILRLTVVASAPYDNNEPLLHEGALYHRLDYVRHRSIPDEIKSLRSQTHHTLEEQVEQRRQQVEHNMQNTEFYLECQQQVFTLLALPKGELEELFKRIQQNFSGMFTNKHIQECWKDYAWTKRAVQTMKQRPDDEEVFAQAG